MFEHPSPSPRLASRRGNDPAGGRWVETMTDERLVTLSQEGNLRAFNDLTDRWQGSIYRYVLRLIGNEEDARDVCQEALVKAYQNIGRLRDGRKFKPWLHHIALNLCRDRYRSAGAKAEVRPFEEEGADEGRLAAERARDLSPEELLSRADVNRTLAEVMQKLPEEQRAAILLREYHGFTSEEIGEITGVPAATVRTRIFYGLRTARRLLGQRGLI
ncbi:MAG: sigma-70 family RNA polymerase sigma factor [Candidatus Eisenbacteria bacterium]|nr:sigma-70 family RNA polymerase sigma factor [Candidatus Latescibacterota bacterium]MBD3301840.1 sigma-70 family RNA polymerase sigma factor [Candidatus Eisenbacteria bacterium]